MIKMKRRKFSGKGPSSNGSSVSLRDYLENRMDGAVAALKDLVEAKFKSWTEALKLQAEEYSRRLFELNHAHSANLQRNAEFVGKEKFESFEREFRQYKESNDKAVEAKAKSLADQVDQKATAAITLVDGKAEALAKEFTEYKTSQATAVALAAGRSSVADPELAKFIYDMTALKDSINNQGNRTAGGRQKMSTMKAALIAGVGVLASLMWAISLGINIWMSLHK